MSTKPYCYLPATTAETGIVASIPHTGTHLPDGVAGRLAPGMDALPMTDWHLHELYDFLPGLGIPVVHATISRFVVDLNRPPTPMALYPGRIETGIVPEKTFWGETVYAEPPADEEVTEWIAHYHRPYHQALEDELARMRARFGRAVLLDLHSVASRASLIHPELEHEIYLGDRDGTSCPAAMTDSVERVYRDAGFAVTRNDPYKGGYITQHYGAMEGTDALQLEMVQMVYMDEDSPEGAPARPMFRAAQQRLRRVLERMIDQGL